MKEAQRDEQKRVSGPAGPPYDPGPLCACGTSAEPYPIRVFPTPLTRGPEAVGAEEELARKRAGAVLLEGLRLP